MSLQRRPVAFTALAVGCLSALMAARQGAPPPQTFRAGVDLVQVDVSVLDKNRVPVRGLTAADFTIREDGKVRPVIAFTPVDLPDRETVAETFAPWVREVTPDVTKNEVPAEGRLIVIMFDWSIRFPDQALARKIAAAAIDELGPGDLAAVVFSSGFGNAGTPQNFTADRARLLEVVNRPFAPAMMDPPTSMRDPRNNNGVMLDDPEGFESGDCYCRLCVPEAIARISDSVRDVPGRRKTMIFIGTFFRGFEGLLQGPIVSSSGAGATASAPARMGNVGVGARPAGGAGACAGPLMEARDKMVRATSLANLTIHTLDPVGMESGGNSPMGGLTANIRLRQDNLSALADSTGGRTVMNTNAPEAMIPAVFAESHSFYLLGFAPTDPSSNGKFHKIDVKVNRPGVSLRTREGYVAADTHAAIKLPTVVSPEAAGALSGVLPRADVPLSVSVAPFAVPGSAEAAVMVALGVRQQLAANPANGHVKVLAAAFDRNGRSVQSLDQALDVAADSTAPSEGSYELLSRLVLKPGRYEIRVGLDASSSQRASVYTYVEVPDFRQDALSMSGIVLGVSPPAVSAPPRAFADLLPVTPTVRRDLAATQHATAFLRIYQGGKDPVLPLPVTMRVIDTRGRPIFEGQVPLSVAQFNADRAADFEFDLPLDRLDAGAYLLSIDATLGKYSARRDLRFSVKK